MNTPTQYPSINWKQNEYVYIQQALTILQDVMAREAKRHEMDAHLTPSMAALLEEEIIPMLVNELDYEPSDEDFGYDGEPPVTMAEMHEAARQEKREAWS
jgi:hypothetical protein